MFTRADEVGDFRILGKLERLCCDPSKKYTSTMNIDTLASVFDVHKGETENLAGKGGLNLKLNIVKSRQNHILSSQRPAVHNHPL